MALSSLALLASASQQALTFMIAVHLTHTDRNTGVRHSSSFTFMIADSCASYTHRNTSVLALDVLVGLFAVRVSCCCLTILLHWFPLRKMAKVNTLGRAPPVWMCSGHLLTEAGFIYLNVWYSLLSCNDPDGCFAIILVASYSYLFPVVRILVSVFQHLHADFVWPDYTISRLNSFWEIVAACG